MKKCILIIACVMVMGVGTAMANERSQLQKFEKRTIVPYPTVPTFVEPIKKMPFHQDVYNKKARPHFMPYIRLGPTPNGRGLGTEFGFKFGIFKSHGLGFGINLF